MFQVFNLIVLWLGSYSLSRVGLNEAAGSYVGKPVCNALPVVWVLRSELVSADPL